MSYELGHDWDGERARLMRLESGLDPATKRHLLALGVGPGFHCLEVGGGAGSIAAWLVDQVGEQGRVVATDLETGFLEALNLPALTVLQHDIVTDPVPEGGFDLIHCRAVLEHVRERDAVVQKLIGALKPGGWLVIESHDFSTLKLVDGADSLLFARAVSGMLELLKPSGFDAEYGRYAAHHLRGAGLEAVDCAAMSYELGGHRPLTPALSLVFSRLKHPLIANGHVSQNEIESLISGLDTGQITAMSPLVVAAWGRKAH